MITKTKSIYIVFVLSVLLVSMSEARKVKAISVSGGEESSLVATEFGAVFSAGSVPGRPVVDYNFARVYAGEMNTISGFLDDIDNVGAGWVHAIVRTNNGQVLTWGSDSSGCLGNGGDGDSAYPIWVYAGQQNPDPDSNLCNIVQVAAGRSGEHSLAVDINGLCYGFGRNNEGQIGNNQDPYEDTQFPVKVHGLDNVGFLQHIISVSAGEQHSMALDANGCVYTFGDNAHYYGGYGKLGIHDDSNTYQAFPHKVHGVNNSGYLQNICAISAGWDHCMALQDFFPIDPNLKGYVYTWGKNGTGWSVYGCSGGRLGNGKNTDFNSTPVLVLDGEMDTESGFLENIQAIGAGESHCIALDYSGAVWAWGDNNYGQLGNGTTTDSLTPVKVHGPNDVGYLSNIVAISAGYWHNLAIDDQGAIYVWGNNANNKLGLSGTTTNRLTPVKIVLEMQFPPSPIILDVNDDITNCVSQNDYINYQIHIDANGFTDSNALLISTLPDEVDCISYTVGGQYDSQTKTLMWDIGAIATNYNAYFTIQVRVNSNAQGVQNLINQVELIGDNYISDDVIETFVCCDHPIIFVDDDAASGGDGYSWESAFNTLTEALENVTSCTQEIWCAAGEYYPTTSGDPDTYNKTFQLFDGINIYGGFQGCETDPNQRNLADSNNGSCSSILFGDIDNNGSRDVSVVVTAADCIIDGFTIKKAATYGILCEANSPTIQNCIITNNEKGIRCDRAPNTNIINCFINYNSTDGVMSWNPNTKINIDRCTINNCSPGVGCNSETDVNITNTIINICNKAIDSFGNVNIDKCTMSDNTQWNPAILLNGGTANIKNSIITGTQGGGIACSAELTVEQCEISQNNGLGVYIGWYLTNVKLLNNWIFKNQDSGIYADSYAEIRNNNIVSNSSFGFSGSGDPNINSNIIYWNNNSYEQFDDSWYTFSKVNYNCVQGGYNGISNISTNPQFVDTVNDDYHLARTSPCINTGNLYFQTSSETDIDSEYRVLESRIEIGADEFNPYDLTLDHITDFLDFSAFAAPWKKSQGQTGYNDFCDFYNDNIINMKDLKNLCTYWLMGADYPGIGGDGAYFANTPYECQQQMQMMMQSFSPEPMIQFEQEIQTEPQPVDVNGLLNWLDDMWQNDEEFNNSMTEQEYLEFRNSIQQSE